MSKQLRFKVGGLARFVRVGSRLYDQTVRVTLVGPWKAGDPEPDGVGLVPFAHDYCIETSEGERAALDEWLAPLPGPDTTDYIHAATRKLFDVPTNSGLPVGPQPRVKA